MAASAVMWPAATAQTSPEKDGFDEAFRELKRDDKLQFELPDTPPEAVQEARKTPEWITAIFDAIGSFFGALAPFMTYIFYGAVALIVGIILFYVLREVIAIRRPEKDLVTQAVPATPLYAPDNEEARILLNAVDRLAAEGKFAEAIHTLLFRSIQDIDLKRPNTIRKSLTSREISRLEILTPDTRRTFGLIAKVVENGYFGGRPLGLEDFKACRAAYEQFAVPNAWAA